MNLVVFECGAVQHADKVCGRSAACGCIFCYPRHLHFVTFCSCFYTVYIGAFYRTWSDFFSIEVEQIMWCSSGSILTDKTDFNKADFEQYLFNKNAIIRVR